MMKRINYHFQLSIVGILLLFAAACRPHYAVRTMTMTVIAVDSTLDSHASTTLSDRLKTELLTYFQPYKDSLQKQMNIVVGHAAAEMPMDRTKHENVLSNWVADILKARAEQLLRSQSVAEQSVAMSLSNCRSAVAEPFPERSRRGSAVDLAIINLGGLRASLPQGAITIGNIYEIAPFENEMVILCVKGSDLLELTDSLAAKGGQGVSGMTFGISKKRRAIEPRVNGEPIDLARDYTVATIDYLAQGGDRMTPLLRAHRVLEPDIKLRDLLTDTIRNAERRGEAIHSQLDGRVWKEQ